VTFCVFGGIWEITLFHEGPWNGPLGIFRDFKGFGRGSHVESGGGGALSVTPMHKRNVLSDCGLKEVL
jgi:hypothetical protein